MGTLRYARHPPINCLPPTKHLTLVKTCPTKVVIPNKKGKWRVCVDYTNLNNACLKDSFPPPRIDQIVDSTVGPLFGHTVEVYIDDIVFKSKTRENHTHHLQEVFHLLREYDMKLNPSKCAFGVSAGKFLGFMVTQRGIEVNPDQIKAVLEDVS
ncbi:hypothetical protein CK203_084156 [Vitis vinifera]|uniref:Reverse transcriptase domain-containing protein n=1 Tax=Vitis vinifera TaxID=29760 RepID=A0A438DUC0_VITVI|nr:hypothetical protein CK203_084156 [Vitis vinifera]